MPLNDHLDPLDDMERRAMKAREDRLTPKKCTICGEPMPAGEEMFKFHGYSGDCPKPPLPRPPAPLTFAQLRKGNVARLPLFKNSKGESAHTQEDGSDWSLGEWMNAVLGELGEAANIVKKVQRGDMTLAEARPALAKEFADVQTYLDITAFRAGVDLGEATRDKWNEVSQRVGCDLRL